MKLADLLLVESEDVYHEKSKTGQTVSAGMLKTFSKNPIEYGMKIRGEIRDEDKPAYKFGRGLHSYVLEGETKFRNEFHVGALINEKTGKAYGADTKKQLEYEAEIGRPIISDEDFAMIKAMDKGVKTNELSNGTIKENGLAERVLRCNYRGLTLQIRIDWLIDNNGKPIIVDLKSCQTLNDFPYDAKKFDYAFNMAFYRLVVDKLSGVSADVYLVASEKFKTHRSGVWKMMDETLTEGTSRVVKALDSLVEMKEAGIYTNNFRSINFI